MSISALRYDLMNPTADEETILVPATAAGKLVIISAIDATLVTVGDVKIRVYNGATLVREIPLSTDVNGDTIFFHRQEPLPEGYSIKVLSSQSDTQFTATGFITNA